MVTGFTRGFRNVHAEILFSAFCGRKPQCGTCAGPSREHYKIGRNTQGFCNPNDLLEYPLYVR